MVGVLEFAGTDYRVQTCHACIACDVLWFPNNNKTTDARSESDMTCAGTVNKGRPTSALDISTCN